MRLKHELAEKYAAKTLPHFLSAHNQDLVRLDDSEKEFERGLGKSLLMVEFLQAHEVELDELVAYIKSRVHIDPASATQMLMYNATADSDWY